eukprot:ANDGO_05842.mRNA.1 Cyclic nucleotide-gated cation channel subunit A
MSSANEPLFEKRGNHESHSLPPIASPRKSHKYAVHPASPSPATPSPSPAEKEPMLPKTPFPAAANPANRAGIRLAKIAPNSSVGSSSSSSSSSSNLNDDADQRKPKEESAPLNDAESGQGKKRLKSRIMGVFSLSRRKKDSTEGLVAVDSGEEFKRDENKVSDQLRERKVVNFKKIVEKQRTAMTVAKKKTSVWTTVAAIVKVMQNVRPESKYRSYWEIFVFFLCVYFWVECPLRACFNLYPSIAVFTVNGFFDLLLCLDIALNFTFPFEQGGNLVTDKKKIRKHYLHTYLIPDILASIPFDLLSVIPGVTYHPVMRINRLFRLYRLDYYFNVIQRRTAMNPSEVRILKFSFIILLTGHFIACLFFLVVYLEADSASNEFTNDDGILDRPVWAQYVRSAYWAFASLTSYGNTEPRTFAEYGFYLFVSIVGIVLYVTIIGTVASLVSNLDSSGQFWRERIDSINDFMRFRRLPEDMQKRIQEYFSYLWQSRRGLDESQVLDDLPGYLRMEIALFLNKDIIEKVPLFKGQNAHFISAVVTKMKPRVVLPGYYVIRKGEIGREMFFIARGEVEVVSEDGQQVFARLSEGSFFGEVALLFSGKRMASVRASMYCDLFVLSKDDFSSVLSEFPDESKQIQEEAQRRYNLNNVAAAPPPAAVAAVSSASSEAPKKS